MEAIVCREFVGLSGEHVGRSVGRAINAKPGDIHERSIDSEIRNRTERQADSRLHLSHSGSLGIVEIFVARREIQHHSGSQVEALRGFPFNSASHQPGVFIIFLKMLVELRSSVEFNVEHLVGTPKVS